MSLQCLHRKVKFVDLAESVYVIPDEGRAPEVEQLLDHPFPAESDRDVKRRVAILEGAEQVKLISG